jgi:hypothetical protein
MTSLLARKMEWGRTRRIYGAIDTFILSQMREMPTGLGLAVRSELCGTRGASPAAKLQ